jgi:hypothetical protein
MNYRNFAKQPPVYLGGTIGIDNLRMQVSKNGDFYTKSNFLVCPNSRCDKQYSNAEGLFGTGLEVKDIFNTGSEYLLNLQEQKQADSAIELQKLQNQNRELELKAAEAAVREQELKNNAAKALTIPIAVAGAVFIFATMAFFSIKKAS